MSRIAAPAIAALALAAAAAPAAAAVRSVVPSLARQPVVPGVTYQRLERPGPQVVHVLRIRRSPLLSVTPALTGAGVGSLGRLTDAVRAGAGAGVVAGINGDYFTFSGGWPSGLLLTGGELVSGPEPTRSSLLLPPDGTLLAARLLLSGRWQAVDPAGAVTLPVRLFSAVNRPPSGSQTVIFTPRWSGATPKGGSRAEALVALDGGGALAPNAALAGTVVAAGTGGTVIPPGHVVIAGTGADAAAIAAELLPGRRVAIEPTIAGIAPGTLEGIGGGPLLVQNGVPVPDAGEGFTRAQLQTRTSRSAIGQAADGSILLVMTEGPGEGSRGTTAAEQAQLMAGLGAVTAVGLDSGGSAALAVGDRLVADGRSERAIASALLVRYGGASLSAPTAERLSPNGDHVDDVALVTARAPRLGRLTLTLERRGGGARAVIADGPYGPGAARLAVDPAALGVPDGPYRLRLRLVPDDGSAPTEHVRPMVIDRTLGALTLRPARGRGRERRLEVRFTLARPARVSVTVLSASGRVLRRLRAERSMRAGRHLVVWDRTLNRKPAPRGRYQILVEARTFLGRTGLAADIGLTPPPPPRGR